MHYDINMYSANTDFEGKQYFGVITMDGVTDFIYGDSKESVHRDVVRFVATRLLPGDTVGYLGRRHAVVLGYDGHLEFQPLPD